MAECPRLPSQNQVQLSLPGPLVESEYVIGFVGKNLDPNFRKYPTQKLRLTKPRTCKPVENAGLLGDGLRVDWSKQGSQLAEKCGAYLVVT